MRCLSCDRALSPYERSRKTLTGMYLDLCSDCYRTIKAELPTVGNPKLMEDSDEETTLFDDSAVDNSDSSWYNNNIDEENRYDDNH